MKEFSELIKNIEVLRRLIREFFVFGYKGRSDYDKKSSRSYDNEKRRVASYFGELFFEERDKTGKKVSILIDSDTVDSNPLYRLFKAKSFTDNDLVLHFVIIDSLRDLPKATAFEISDYISNNYNLKEDLFDIGTIRGKLNEYADMGILLYSKESNKLYYRLSNELDEIKLDWDMIYYFSEVDVLGVIGSYILDRKDNFIPNIKFKHRQLFASIDSLNLFLLLNAIKDRNILRITRKTEGDNRKKAEMTTRVIVPLKIIVNRQNGRQYLAAYDLNECAYLNYRLDHITEIEFNENIFDKEDFILIKDQLEKRLLNTWNINFQTNSLPKKVELVIKVEKNEGFILNRLKREGHDGVITQIAEDKFLYTKSVYDPTEMIPWVKSFIGRIVSFTCEDKMIEDRLYNDLNHIMEEWLDEI